MLPDVDPVVVKPVAEDVPPFGVLPQGQRPARREGLNGTVPGKVFPARHAGLRSGEMGTVRDDIERCESTKED